MKLFYFPARETDVGIMPAFYDEIGPENEKHAREMGGRDVSDDQGAWQDYEADLRYQNECCL